MWTYYFWRRQVDSPLATFERVPFPYGQFILVLAAGALVRLYKITELPLGPYPDEIFTLNNSLALAHRPLDFFGHTPLFTLGWVETANLYLYFNLLIVKIFGVSYWSMKLFSVIPGILACAVVFAIARLLISPGAALGTALLFTFAHWPVRLSRYGWDVSFMIMAFSVAIWLLILAFHRGRLLHAYLAGVACGICLYSYLGARICLLSLLLWFAVEFVLSREQWIRRYGSAFSLGVAMTAYPLLLYYLEKPITFGIRTAELSVFNSTNPFGEIIHNIWRHALMFFTHGGAYARDNFPGLPMLDPLTGLLLFVGLGFLFKERKKVVLRLVACTFIINFVTGVFSVSQEGAPYVYRTAAVAIPAFLIVGLAIHHLLNYLDLKLKDTIRQQSLVQAYAFFIFGIIALNCFYYFGLEPTNTAAMRVMAYETRLIGLEIAQDHLPAILIGRDMLDQPVAKPNPSEKFAYANPPLILPPAMRLLGIIEFSGRYDKSQTVKNNLELPKNIHLMDSDFLSSSKSALPRPAKLIFRSENRQLWNLIRTNYPTAYRRDITDIQGEPRFAVAILPNSAAPTAETPAGQ